MKIPKSEKLQPKDYGEESANGSGIQPEQVEDIMDFVEPEEYLKTEDEIRDAFEKIELIQHCFKYVKWMGGFYQGVDSIPNGHDDIVSSKLNNMLDGYEDGYKSRQQEIEELKKQSNKWHNRHHDLKLSQFDEIVSLKSQLSEKDKQIVSMKCCGNCDQENLQADCLITSKDITRHNYTCSNWKLK